MRNKVDDFGYIPVDVSYLETPWDVGSSPLAAQLSAKDGEFRYAPVKLEYLDVPLTPPDEPGVFSGLFKGVARGAAAAAANITEGAGEAMGLLDEDLRIGAVADDIREIGEDVADLPQRYEDNYSVRVGEFLGKVAVSIGIPAGAAALLAAAPVGATLGAVLGQGAILTLSAAEIMGEAAKRARDYGATEQQQAAAAKAALPGIALELIRTRGIVPWIPLQYRGTWTNWLGSVPVGAAVDVGQQGVQNLAARSVYNPEQDLSQGSGTAMLAGATKGLFGGR